MAKTDIKNAFRLLPIHPEDYGLLGLKWKGLYYYDKCMPMGCSSSCLTFETFSTALEWIAKQKLRIDYILHLLDDFLMAAHSKELLSVVFRFVFKVMFISWHSHSTRENNGTLYNNLLRWH